MTTSGWRRGGVLALGLLFLAACSENVDLFSSLDEQDEPQLSTVSAGTVMGTDDALELQIEYPSDESSRATSMRVELRDTEGAVHGTVEFTAAELAEPLLPLVEFSQPPEGVYRLVTEAWINDQPLFSDQRQIFVTSAPPRIESVTIHPTSIRQEMQALAVADIDFALSTRPYVRWIFDGGVLAEGYLEDGLDRAIIDGAERNAGAYPVSLEVYPWGVDEGTVIDGSTTITANSDVVIREEREPTPPDFAPLTLGTVVRYFSFDGTRRAWTDTPMDEVVQATVEGDPFLDIVSGALGVRIPAESVVSAPIPVPERGGTVYSVAVRMTTSHGEGVYSRAPVISLDADESVPIVIENGMLIAYPPGASPMPLGSAPDEGELSTLQFGIQNQDGDLFLTSEMTMGSQVAIPLGRDSQEISLSVLGPETVQMFLDRITVTALSIEELRTQSIDRTTERFLSSFGTELRAWAVATPAEWAASAPVAAPVRSDYPRAEKSISFGEAEGSRV
ncbi:MAG TPA: hypothetical protein VJ932_00505, partial [Alkalispirochaeta sp.]|nr:hypothetical protein [Alkalispirochaeta sp.]